MNTYDEKIEEIKTAMELAKERINVLKRRVELGIELTKSERYELDMCFDIMARGYKLLNAEPIVKMTC